ncbi:hypothetical protein [Actinoalloteichus hymeniacidonis]|uniref:hypothetical protein n=1 Tax=Actinoalloteichus hymeniacidonis TaxID=340345 RepID=UPI0012FC20CD|nr:hypothetical protein [Actinoalloteichus hymeniacidonis]MBB5907279.1 hypothetical protein [Actinoalloteichus hymeniacidonis]
MAEQPENWIAGKANRTQGDALSYWTRERMLNAQPMPLETVEVGAEGPPEVILVSREELEARRTRSRRGTPPLDDSGEPVQPAGGAEF